MTLGEYIKKLRKENGLTQEELGAKLEPQIQKAAINKWEKGIVANLKRSYIEQLARIFSVEPITFINPDYASGTYEDIESKVKQLTPEEQKEVLNYINFVINKRNESKLL